MPTSVIGFVDRSCRRSTMSPRLRFSRPATISISVLLPQPDGPTTDTNSPASMSTLTSFSARNGLSVSSPNVFDTRRMRDRDAALARASDASAIVRFADHCATPSDAATASSGTFDTSSAFARAARRASSWLTTSTSNVAIACVGFDLLSRSSAIR